MVNKQKHYEVGKVKTGKLIPALCDQVTQSMGSLTYIYESVCELKHEKHGLISFWNSMDGWKM